MGYINRTSHYLPVAPIRVRRLTCLRVSEITYTQQETFSYHIRALGWRLTKGILPPSNRPLRRWLHRRRSWCFECMGKPMVHQARGLGSLQTGCSLRGLLEENGENGEEDDIEDWKVEETGCNATVELMSSLLDVDNSIATGTNMGFTASNSTGLTPTTASVETVHTLDPFAKAKISNFIQRMASLPCPSSSNISGKPAVSNGPPQNFDKSLYTPEVREVQGHPGVGKQYHATLRLPLPDEYGLRYGEGFAGTERDAELVAAMHAERVLDALGFHVYRLSSKQSRHAEAARKAGRWAPMPDEGEKGQSRPPPTTPSPPPLQYTMEDAIMTMTRQLELNKVEFVNVSRGVFTPLQYTLASPYFFDPGSIKRIRCFFEAYNANIEHHCKVIALHKILSKKNKKYENSKSRGGQLSDNTTEENHSFLAQLKLPIASRFGERVCMGKGPSKKDAVALACMHAELVIDTLGLALYPQSKEKQSAHAAECAKVQRWCAPAGDCDFRYDALSPQPLQILEEQTVATRRGMSMSSSEAYLTERRYVDNCSMTSAPASVTRDTREKWRDENAEVTTHTVPVRGEFTGTTTNTAPPIAELQNGDTSVETMLLQHSHAVNNFSWVQDVASVEKSAKLVLDHYLDHYYQTKSLKNANALPGTSSRREVLSPYLVECLGIKRHETYRATVTVPLFISGGPCNGECADQSDEQGAKERKNGEMRDNNATFTAIGIAKSSHEAEMAAATHALKVLSALNHPIVFSSESAFLFPSLAAALSSDGRQDSFPRYDSSKRIKELHEVVSNPSCVPVRYIGKEHVGRITIPGLASEQKTSISSMNRGRAASHSPFNSSSRVFNHLKQETTLMEAFLEARQTLPKSDWSLEEDGNNRIVVNPSSTRESGRSYIHTLPGVRTPDVHAINRLQDYLERHGKRLETSLMYSWQEVDDAGIKMGQGSSTQGNLAEPHTGDNGKRLLRPLLHVVKVLLPVSQRFGGMAGKLEGGDPKLTVRFIAHGEAYNEDDAVLMCAMHAELLLDTLGIPFYDHFVIQRKHIDTANMLGRKTADGATANVPPPVRKEHPNSCLWARIQIRLAKEATTRPQPLLKKSDASDTLSAVSSYSKSDMASQADSSFQNKQSKPSANGQDASDPSSFEFTDDNLCDLSKLQPIHHTEVFRQALKHIQGYFQQRGSDFFRMVRRYTVKTPGHGTVYRAIVEIPVPKVYGKRFGVGCASTKGRALNLCASHSVWTLDALNIPIFSGRVQAEYARASRMAGRRSPMPGDALMPGDTPSPKGLCDLSVGTIERPDPPLLPSLEQIKGDATVWFTYIRLCKIFLRKNQEASLHESLFQLHQAPRSGVAVEDEGLNLVERMPINSHAKHQLMRLCADAGLPRPEPFRYNTYGKAPEKWFLVETPVLGTVFKARGLAQNAADSLLRTAMHYEYLIRTAVLGQRVPLSSNKGLQKGCLVPNAGERVRRGRDLFDATKGDFSAEGKAAVLALYAATHPPYQPVQLVLRDGPADPEKPPVSVHKANKQANSNSPVDRHIVVTAELSDDLGLHHLAKGEDSSNESEAIERALSGLFHLLQRKAAMQSIGQIVKRHPSMRMGALCTLVFDKEEIGVAASNATLISLCKAAREGVNSAPFISEESILDELKDLPVEGSRDLLSSSHAVVLLDIVARRLDQSTTNAPLSHPAFMSDSFPALGLLAESVHMGANSKKHRPDEASKGMVTAVAGVVALLLQCIPRQASNGSRSHILQHGPLLPIQLAKLLLAGFLFDCVPFAVCMTAMVMDLQGICGIVNNHPCGCSDKESDSGVRELQWHDWQSVDLVGEMLHPSFPLSSLVETYENEIVMRLREVQTLIEQYAPASQLAGLFSRFKDLKEILKQAKHQRNEAKLKDLTFLEARLRMCVAFATYPQVLVPKIESPRIVGGLIVPGAADSSITVLEPMDGAQQAHIKTSSRHARSPFACFDILLRNNTDVGQTTSSREADAAGLWKSSRPRQAGVERAHICVVGTSVPSFVNIIATVLGCNKYHVLSVQEEIPNLGVMVDGTIPLVFPSTAVLEAVRELQDIFAQSLSYLRPPPYQALHALHTLLHSSENSNRL